MSEKKQKNIQEIIERSRKAKQPHTKMLDKKLGKQKSSAKFNKVNFNG